MRCSFLFVTRRTGPVLTPVRQYLICCLAYMVYTNVSLREKREMLYVSVGEAKLIISYETWVGQFTGLSRLHKTLAAASYNLVS